MSRIFFLILFLLIVKGCGGSGEDNSSINPEDSASIINDLDNDGVIDSIDCAPEVASEWELVNYQYRDRDLDGRYSLSVGELCTNGTLPTNYTANDLVPNQIDCDDFDQSKWRMVVIYQDLDGDGVGSGQGNTECIGERAHSGYSILGFDPLDDLSDPDSPSVTEFDIPPSTKVVMESDADPDDV